MTRAGFHRAATLAALLVVAGCASDAPPPPLAPAAPVVVEVPVVSPPTLVTITIPVPTPCAPVLPPPVEAATLSAGADIFAAARAAVLELLDLREANSRLRGALAACAE